jgi:hypothetical protein
VKYRSSPEEAIEELRRFDDGAQFPFKKDIMNVLEALKY